jgi:hypothetical protein
VVIMGQKRPYIASTLATDYRVCKRQVVFHSEEQSIRFGDVNGLESSWLADMLTSL